MAKPKVLILKTAGINCDRETAFAFENAGADIDLVHINELVSGGRALSAYQILAISGGFTYGDDIAAGKVLANELKCKLFGELKKFTGDGKLIIGICNGFQIITTAGFVPGTLLTNDSGRYSCRWVDLEVTGESPWLKGIKLLSVPIAHGEGKYFAPPETLTQLKKDGAIALKYANGETAKHFSMPANPNGALENIAGVTSHNGRVLGLMPHPERAVRFTQLPHWTNLREEYARSGKPLPKEGPGLQIFKNAVNYFI